MSWQWDCRECLVTVLGNLSKDLVLRLPRKAETLRASIPMKKMHRVCLITHGDDEEGSVSTWVLTWNSGSFSTGLLAHVYSVTSVMLTLCDPMNCSPLGSPVHSILQARLLEQFAISSSKGSAWPRDQTQVSCTEGRFFTAEPLGKPFGSVNSNQMVLETLQLETYTRK